MFQSNKNISSWLFRLLKLLIALLALWFIYKRVFIHEGLPAWLDKTQESLTASGSLIYLSVVFILMIANWMIEAIKWKFMISKIERLSLLRSLEAVLSGITVSFFTPNRIGEYAGRVFHLREGDRITGTLITVLENFSQLVITLVFGTLALLILDQSGYLVADSRFTGFLPVAALIAVPAFLLYINAARFDRIAVFLPEKWKSYANVFEMYRRKELLLVLLLSIIRYLIFCLQYYLLLRVFGLYSGFFVSILLISLIYLILAIVPTFTLTELGVRGAVAAYLFESVYADGSLVINASFALWIINLVIPALAGALFILSFRMKRRIKSG